MLSKTVLMHCVSLYPTPLKKINLNFIQTLKKKFKLPVGFSDHSIGTRGSGGRRINGCELYREALYFR